jgi:DNA-binding PadR family transcriptional regulator
VDSRGFKPDKIWMERALIKSPAFRSLSLAAMLVYSDFLGKARFTKLKQKGRKDEYIIINNGEITYTYSEAGKNGISRPRFQRALDELVEKGFIDITHQGSGGIKGDKSKYAISERWRNYGKENFVKETRPKDTRKGRGFDAHWEKKKMRNQKSTISVQSTNVRRSNANKSRVNCEEEEVEKFRNR